MVSYKPNWSQPCAMGGLPAHDALSAWAGKLPMPRRLTPSPIAAGSRSHGKGESEASQAEWIPGPHPEAVILRKCPAVRVDSCVDERHLPFDQFRGFVPVLDAADRIEDLDILPTETGGVLQSGFDRDAPQVRRQQTRNRRVTRAGGARQAGNLEGRVPTIPGSTSSRDRPAVHLPVLRRFRTKLSSDRTPGVRS